MTQARSERNTQKRVIDLFTSPSQPDSLRYQYLGNWTHRENNRCLETGLTTEYLTRQGYSSSQISAALQRLERTIDITGKTLYETNLATYNLLRYGIQVQTGAGRAHETVHLIDWGDPENNDFSLAEEVTLKTGNERRIDLVIYLNGLALGMIELKRAPVDILKGIHQLFSNQDPIFNPGYFSAAQLLFAGNDSQGLHYGTIGTPEQNYLTWKDTDLAAIDSSSALDRALAQMCDKRRLLDMIQHGMIFDAGRKKVPRVHQYIGLQRARERILKREGGVIWHTQGSGKSILMAMLAKWILEHDPHGRLLIVTDRDELDKQIEGVIRSAGVISNDTGSPRITSRVEFLEKLAAPHPRVLCALIHKFGGANEAGGIGKMEQILRADPPNIQGKFYVFVDECHRTQGGNMNRLMKRWLSSAIFIGFTGTPLLRSDKQTTREVFGTNIHTYKFDEAVRDKVVLDLKYEARAVPQRLTSKTAIDEWFKEKTRGLGAWQQAKLRERWATIEQLMSSEDRKRRIVGSIIHDFNVKPRLNNDRGTAILVSSTIYDACHYFRLFKNTPFGRYCGIITSYEPSASSISSRPSDSDERYKYDTYQEQVLDPGQSTSAYEDQMKRRFIKEPANCKLLIVVSKLLTGFDAPSCTIIYLDSEIRDHNLFQAICRTNRLDGLDKDYGYIVDFKELFHEVQNSIAVYTSDELDTDETDGSDGNPTIKNSIEEGRQRLKEAQEALYYLCDPVAPPKAIEQFLRYFCGDTNDPEALQNNEPLRIEFYKAVANLIRSYASLAPDLDQAGYTEAQIDTLKAEVAHYTEIREALKRHAGEELDITPYEADMRHLINTYIQADSPEAIGSLNDLSLVELIVDTGINNAIAQRLNQKGKLSKNGIAEGIINNVRRTLIRGRLTDPRFYQQMSDLLEDLIRQRREETLSYEEFLRRIEETARSIAGREQRSDIPFPLQGNPQAIAIYNNLPEILPETSTSESDSDCWQEPGESQNFMDPRVDLAVNIDRALQIEAPADWRGDETRERTVKNLLFKLLGKNKEATLDMFEFLKKRPGNP